MSTNVTWNGVTYAIPTSGEINWASLTNFLLALGGGAAVAQEMKQAIRIATTSPVTVVAATDFAVLTNLASAGAVAVALPVGVSGQVFIIKDSKGDAGTNNVTITPNGAETIDGAATLVLNHNYQMVCLQFVSGDWKTLFNVTKSGTIVDADIAASAGIAWSKVSKSGSNLTDIATRSHTNLSDIGTNTHAQIDSALSAAIANPMSAVGDTMYGGTAGAATRLAGNTTTTKKFLRETGSGSAATAPAWDTIAGTDLPTPYYGSGLPEVGGSSPFQMTIAHNPVQVLFPAVDIVVRLPTTGIPAGYVVKIINKDTSLKAVDINSSNGQYVNTIIYGYVTLMAMYATPTAAAHWITIEAASFGPVLFTPSTLGLGTLASSSMRYTRYMNMMTAWGRTTAGTVDSNAVAMAIPYSYSADTNKLPSSKLAVGEIYFVSTSGATISAANMGLYWDWAGPSNVCVTASVVSGVYVAISGSGGFENGGIIDWMFKLPISQWAESH